MDKNVKAVFEDECKSLVIDARLVKRLRNYRMGFVNKNQDHIEFFGGHLLGVHVVRFTDSERDQWFDEILEVDPGPLGERLLSLPTINPEARGFKSAHVTSDTFNLSCAWLVHALYRSKALLPAQKHQAMVDVLFILQCKILTSFMFHSFRYPADPEVAEATYAQLSYKFAIKQYGSWTALLEARSESMLSGDSIHLDAIHKMENDDDVTRLLSDVRGRVVDTVKNIYSVFMLVKNQGIRIASTSSVIEHDGEEILKDKSKSTLAYGRYLNAIVTDKPSFIKEELAVVIEKIMHTMPPRLFRETLGWMSDNYRQSGAGVIEEVLNEVLIHSFDYLSHNRSVIHNDRDLSGLLAKLRGVYMSSRSTDPALLSLREKTETVVKQATGNKNESIVASVRTGVLLYLVIRAYTMKYYSS